MNEVAIILGTTSEVVQKAIDHANANIVSNWMTFGVFLGATAIDWDSLLRAYDKS